jgi:3',5'-cyclic AMP phosphodiesterase CpdA
MPEQTLLTVLHISDLHFSDKMSGGYDADVPRFLAHSAHFDGVLGHNYVALTALHAFCGDLFKEDPKYQMIISGDLTANGRVLQFDIANSYLGTHWPQSAFNMALGCAGWSDWSVPGNHDHWPGNNRVLGSPTRGLSKYFKRPFMRILPKLTLRNGTTLQFLRVNTDADVGPFSLDRLLGRGKFATELIKLDKDLARAPDNEARVLILHHSMMPSTPEGPAGASRNWLPPLVIEPKMRRVLEHFLVEFDIKVLLCGHLHTPRLSHFNASNDVEQSSVLEARCGTTTQLDKYPYDVLQKIGSGRRLQPNTLIVHKIVERGSEVYWKSQVYWLAKSGKFVKTLNYVSPDLPRRLTTEIRVLPR